MIDQEKIIIKGAREHNLQNIDLEILPELPFLVDGKLILPDTSYIHYYVLRVPLDVDLKRNQVN